MDEILQLFLDKKNRDDKYHRELNLFFVTKTLFTKINVGKKIKQSLAAEVIFSRFAKLWQRIQQIDPHAGLRIFPTHQ